LIPFGRLREPLVTMRRADAVIVTRADRPFDYASLTESIKSLVGEVPVHFTSHTITGLREIKTDEAIVPETYSGKPVAAFCGIGNPNIFFSDLEYFKIEIAWQKAFIDHHFYTKADISEIIDAAKNAQAEAIITTEKDAVKIENLIEGKIPFYAAQLDVEPDEDIKLKSMVLRAVANKQREVRRRKK